MERQRVLCKACRLEFDHDALFCPNCGTAKNRDLDGDPLLGVTIGDRYQLIKQIGQGSSGAIYLAEHVTLRRKVVVKVLHPELSRDDLAIERFRREATTVGDLDNDHIVEIYDFGRTKDGRLYLAMEYLEGQTLADLLKEKGQLSKDLAVDILIQIGEALIEAHAMGYVHRDLRPRNMFLAVRRKRANFLKLLDFGLAKLVEKEGEAASTSLGMTFGDPHYMSPEQARGEPVDRRADIYSMGCIAYELLTGKPPFHGGKVFDVLTRHVQETPAPLHEMAPQTPAWLERAIMRCLAKKPEERYITVYRFVEALRQGVDSGVIMSDEVAQREPATPPASVSRAMEKLAAREGKEAPLSVLAPDGENYSGKTKTPIGSQTVLGIGATPPKGIVSSNAETLPVMPVESHAKPSVSENVASSDVPLGQASAMAATEVAGSVPTAKAGQSAGLSAIWYADGESLDGSADLSEDELAKLEKARGRSPSNTGLMSSSGDEDLYEDDFYPPQSRKKLFIAIGVVVFLAGLAFAFWPSGETTKSAESARAAAVIADAAGLPPVVQIDAGSTPVADAGIAAAKPRDVKPRDVKPRDVKPRDVKPRDVKPRDVRPRDVKPRDVRPRDTPPPVDRGPTEADKTQAAEFASQGRRDLQSGDILGAASKFNKARSLNPRNAQAYLGLGEIALGQGAYAAAIGHLGKASKIRPRSARTWTLLGEAFLGTGNGTKAADAFKKALKINPDSARARNGYNEATGN